MKQMIWTSSLDLSQEGIDRFCREAAPRYGKTAAQLRALPVLELAATYMVNERRRKFYETKEKLSASSPTPILVIADKADFGNKFHHECSVLSGEHISDIFSCRTGLVTTFYSDGADIRCEDINEHGTDFYLFRVVTNLKNLQAFISSVERGEAFTPHQLNQCTASLAPQVHEHMGWNAVKKPDLDSQIHGVLSRHTPDQTRDANQNHTIIREEASTR